jgi:hypothetical protein
MAGKLQKYEKDLLGLCGGSWDLDRVNARVSVRLSCHPVDWYFSIGFRVVAFPSGRS